MNVTLFTLNLVPKNPDRERALSIAITGTVLPVLTFHVAVFQITMRKKKKKMIQTLAPKT